MNLAQILFPSEPAGAFGGNNITSAEGEIKTTTVEYPIVSLNIYGKSVQEGTPHPDTPAEITSVGDMGLEISLENEPESGPSIGISAFISTGTPLCSIDGVRDELVYNADGNGKAVKKFGVATLTSANIQGMTEHAGLGNFFYTNIVGAIGENSNAKPICNRFIGVTFANRAVAEYINTFRCFMGQDGRLVLRCAANDNRFTSPAELQNFVEENETVVIYPLAEAQEIELTAEEMKELQALRTFNGLTTISNDEGAEMVVKCCTNPLLSELVMPVIDGITARLEARIAALEAAVTNT